MQLDNFKFSTTDLLKEIQRRKYDINNYSKNELLNITSAIDSRMDYWGDNDKIMEIFHNQSGFFSLDASFIQAIPGTMVSNWSNKYNGYPYLSNMRFSKFTLSAIITCISDYLAQLCKDNKYIRFRDIDNFFVSGTDICYKVDIMSVIISKENFTTSLISKRESGCSADADILYSNMVHYINSYHNEDTDIRDNRPRIWDI